MNYSYKACFEELSGIIVPYYEQNLDLADHKTMVAELAGIKGKLILSINDLPDIRGGMFRPFQISLVSRKYTIAKGKQTAGRELVISKYKICYAKNK